MHDDHLDAARYRTALDLEWAEHVKARQSHAILGFVIVGLWMAMWIVAMFAMTRDPPPKPTGIFTSSIEPDRPYRIIDGLKVYVDDEGSKP